MKKSAIIILFAAIIIAANSCKKESTDQPVIPVLKYLGWAVGGSDGNFGTILHTEDGGKTWVRQGSATQLPNVEFADILVYDKNNLLLVGGKTSTGTPCVYKSTDGGNNWFPAGGKGLPNASFGGIFNIGKEHTWILGDSGSMYHSENMGVSWTKINIPGDYRDDNLLRGFAKDKNDIWIVGDEDVTDNWPLMLHSTNGGVAWTRLNPLQDLNIQPAFGGHYLGIKVFDNSVWAIGGFGMFVLYSGDNGVTWEDRTGTSGGDGDANDIFLLDETVAYVVKDYGQVYSTWDAGIHWTEYFPYTNDWIVGIAVVNNVNIWICGSSGGGDEYAQIMYSPDAGTSWQDQTPAYLVNNKFADVYKIRVIESY